MAPAAEMGDPTAAYIVLAIALLVEGGSFSVAMKQFRLARGDMGAWQYIKESKDPSLYTVVIEDSAAMFGLVFAFLGIFPATCSTTRISTAWHPLLSACF